MEILLVEILSVEILSAEILWVEMLVVEILAVEIPVKSRPWSRPLEGCVLACDVDFFTNLLKKFGFMFQLFRMVDSKIF